MQQCIILLKLIENLIYYLYTIVYMKKRIIVPISLPDGLARELDELVREGQFASRNEALKFGVRLVIMMLRRTHERAEDYAYEEIKEGILRGKKANVS